MLPILAMLTSEFIIDAIEIYALVYVGTGAVNEVAQTVKKIKKIGKDDDN